MTAKIPGARGRGRYLSSADLVFIRLSLALHQMAECDRDDCPVTWLAGFLEGVEADLARIGDGGRAQLWASLVRLPAEAGQLPARVTGNPSKARLPDPPAAAVMVAVVDGKPALEYSHPEVGNNAFRTRLPGDRCDYFLSNNGPQCDSRKTTVWFDPETAARYALCKPHEAWAHIVKLAPESEKWVLEGSDPGGQTGQTGHELPGNLGVE